MKNTSSILRINLNDFFYVFLLFMVNYKIQLLNKSNIILILQSVNLNPSKIIYNNILTSKNIKI